MEWSSRIRRKPILVIDFSNQDKEESEDESEDKLKPPYSVKNSQEISRLNTAKTQAKIYFLEQKMLEMEKLERENYSLVRSLRALKIGAAEALAEK